MRRARVERDAVARGELDQLVADLEPARAPAGAGSPPRRGARAASPSRESPGCSSQTAISNAPSADGDSSSERRSPSSSATILPLAAPHDPGDRALLGEQPERGRPERVGDVAERVERRVEQPALDLAQHRDADAGALRHGREREARARGAAGGSLRRAGGARARAKSDPRIHPLRRALPDAVADRTPFQPLHNARYHRSGAAAVTAVLVTGAAGGLGGALVSALRRARRSRRRDRPRARRARTTCGATRSIWPTRRPSRRRSPTPRRRGLRDPATSSRSRAARCPRRRPAPIWPSSRSRCSGASLELNLVTAWITLRAALPHLRRADGRPLDHAHDVHRRARELRPAGLRGRQGGPDRPRALARGDRSAPTGSASTPSRPATCRRRATCASGAHVPGWYDRPAGELAARPARHARGHRGRVPRADRHAARHRPGDRRRRRPDDQPPRRLRRALRRRVRRAPRRTAGRSPRSIGSSTRIASCGAGLGEVVQVPGDLLARLPVSGGTSSACGRSPAAGSSETSDAGAALDRRGIAPGALCAIALISAFVGREALGACCRRRPTTCSSCRACGSVAASCRGPLVPSMIGVVRAGGGSSTASSTCQKRALARHVLAREQAADDLEALEEARLARWSNGSPKARNSGSFQPEPTPSTKRPPLISSIAAAMRATRPGGWNARHATSGPSATRSVSRGERGHAPSSIPRPALRPPVVAVEQVIADPDRVEPDLLGGARHREVLGPAHDALDLGQLHSDAQGAGHPGHSRRKRPNGTRGECHLAAEDAGNAAGADRTGGVLLAIYQSAPAGWMRWFARNSSYGVEALADLAQAVVRRAGVEGLAVDRALGEVEVGLLGLPGRHRVVDDVEVRLDAPRASSGVNGSPTEKSTKSPSRWEAAPAPAAGRPSAPPSWRSSTEMKGEPEPGPATSTKALIASSGSAVEHRRRRRSPACGPRGRRAGGRGRRRASSRASTSRARARAAARAARGPLSSSPM